MKNILLIESAHTHQQYYREFIKHLQANITCVKNDHMAKVALRINKYDLVIIGCCVMDDQTFSLVNEIRSNKVFDNTKLLKLCPSKDPEKCKSLRDKGVDEVILMQNFSRADFIFCVKSLLNRKEAAKLKIVASAVKPVIAKVEEAPILKKKMFDWSTVQTLITSQELEKKLKKASSAKAIPCIVTELLDLTSSINSDFKELIHLIELDPALTARVLRCANSAFYRGNRAKIYKLGEAVKTMGFNGLKDLVLGIGILDSFSENASENGLNRIKLWYHSITTGVVAREIANMIQYVKPDSLFVMGILHDIGTAIFDEYFHNNYQTVLKTAIDNELHLEEVESKMLSMDHSEVAIEVLKYWGFPETLTAPVGTHHKTYEELLNSTSKLKQEMIIVRFADDLSKILGSSLFDYEEIPEIPVEVFNYLKIDPKDLIEKLNNIKDIVAELMQIMLLHMKPEELKQCDSFANFKVRQCKKVLLFNNGAKFYSPIEILLKQFDYKVTTAKNLFILPDSKSFDVVILDLSDDDEIANVITIIKKLQKNSTRNSRLCIIAQEEIKLNLTSNKELSSDNIYLTKPYQIRDLLSLLEKLSALDKQAASF